MYKVKKTALVMAGGRGERFWPRSRKSFPKQFLALTDDGRTMIQLTVARILPLVDIEDIFVVTNNSYRELVKEQLPELPGENIICEPMGKNTAPCIGLGAMHISKKYGDAIMMVLPSDHLIKYNGMFVNVMEEACQLAELDTNLVTLGITPDYPETGYGYIKFNPKMRKGTAFDVDRFVEKPSLELAKEYLETEEYLWNSGMFIWKVSSILENMRLFLGNIYSGLMNIKESIGTEDYNKVLDEKFSAFKSESIDYGIMEKAKNIYTIPCAFGWDDVGSWLAVERIRKSNEHGCVISGNVITADSYNCIIEGSEKLIATVGIEDLVIVDSQDAILICEKKSTGKIKDVLESLRKSNMDEYL